MRSFSMRSRIQSYCALHSKLHSAVLNCMMWESAVEMRKVQRDRIQSTSCLYISYDRGNVSFVSKAAIHSCLDVAGKKLRRSTRLVFHSSLFRVSRQE